MTCCCCSDRLELTDEQRKALLERIIKTEEEMFINVNGGKDRADCQEQLKTFRAMRNMSFAVLSNDTLQAYYEDLRFAVQDDRNMVMEKYARMDNLIPPLSDNPLIDEIVAIETAWMEALHKKYPHAINMSENFANYEHSELETYSDSTIGYYHQDVITAKQMGINLVEERYKILYKGMGFKSLQEVEEQALARMKKTN